MATIRGYKKEDYQKVKDILEGVNLYDDTWDSEENLEKMVSSDKNSVLVAEEDGKVVGNIMVINYGSKLQYFFRLAVKKEYRNKGIGTALIEKVTKIAKENGVKELGMYVDSANDYLDNFYQKRNFKKSSGTYYYMWKEI